jgi:Protein of unknown function (DUF559)/Transcriptional regulator, AbiEi antitoxin
LAIVQLAERQHGVVARHQLSELGIGRRAIGSRLAAGRLHAIHRGVYAVGHRVLSARGRWMECDCVWLSHRLIVELDGRATHDTAAAFERDRARDRLLQAAGWRVPRITWKQLQHDGDRIAADLRELMDE